MFDFVLGFSLMAKRLGSAWLSGEQLNIFVFKRLSSNPITVLRFIQSASAAHYWEQAAH